MPAYLLLLSLFVFILHYSIIARTTVQTNNFIRHDLSLRFVCFVQHLGDDGYGKDMIVLRPNLVTLHLFPCLSGCHGNKLIPPKVVISNKKEIAVNTYFKKV